MNIFHGPAQVAGWAVEKCCFNSALLVQISSFPQTQLQDAYLDSLHIVCISNFYMMSDYTECLGHNSCIILDHNLSLEASWQTVCEIKEEKKMK